MNTRDLSPILETAGLGSPARGLSATARTLEGSEILAIAYDVRDRIAQGDDILNLTVGDFAPTEFPIPASLKQRIGGAYDAGQTNYPPAAGVPELRRAVQELFAHRLGLGYPIESVIVGGGGRPMIASAYLALIDRGDRVVYGVPSWNNNYYTHIVGAEPVELATGPETFFFPKVEAIEPHLEHARLLCLNTPQNPTGTVMDTDALEHVSRRVVEENARRRARGTPALYVLYDQIYWLLTFTGARHTTPVSLVPEMAAYTIFIDGVSKGFAATGLRVGWAVGPQDVVKKMGAFLSHLGAWAPRPEQIGTAAFLEDSAAVDQHLSEMSEAVLRRLNLVADAVAALKADGWQVDCIAPQGAIYLSIRLGLAGLTPAGGQTLRSDEDVRRFILEQAGIALVPFRCFGVTQDCGWFRASVGSVSEAQCGTIHARLKRAFRMLNP